MPDTPDDDVIFRTGFLGDRMVGRSLDPGRSLPNDGIKPRPGPLRFAKNPATAVLDGDGKARERDNFHVTDTNLFSWVGAVPKLTMAHALPVAGRIVERLR